MENLIDFLAKKEVLILLSVLCLLFLLWVILLIQHSYVKLKEKSKLKQNTQELKNLVQEVKEEEKRHPIEKVSAPTVQEEIPKTTVSSFEEMMNQITPQVVLAPKSEQAVIPVESIQEEKLSTIATSTLTDVTVENVSPSKVVADESKQEEEKKPSIQEEKIVYKEEVYTQTEAQEELERLTKELEKEEGNPARIELTAFEAKQEENAIISLEELLKKGKSLVASNEEVQYKDEGNEPISIQDLEEKMKKQKEEIYEVPSSQEDTKKVQMVDMNTASIKPIQEAYQPQNEKKYTPSPVISPVFGLRDEKKVHDDSLELEDTANFEKLDEEIRKTNEFLVILKELQKKLD